MRCGRGTDQTTSEWPWTEEPLGRYLFRTTSSGTYSACPADTPPDRVQLGPRTPCSAESTWTLLRPSRGEGARCLSFPACTRADSVSRSRLAGLRFSSYYFPCRVEPAHWYSCYSDLSPRRRRCGGRGARAERGSRACRGGRELATYY
jgi:hypothetical protein